MSVGDRLARLLFIVPYVSDRDGVPLAELAKTLGATPRQIQSDLDLLSLVGQPPLTPDHLIDMYVEDDIVYVDLDQSLSRPLRLTHEEAGALVLAGKLVSQLGGLGDELASVLSKLVEKLNPADRQMLSSLSERIGVGGDGGLGLQPASALRAAVRECEHVVVHYYSASSDQNKRYRLKPLAVLAHGGVEYLVALDTGARDREKLFRLDRMAHVEHTGEPFEPPKGFDLEKFRKRQLYFGRGGFTATVAFDAARARQVRERFSAKDLSSQSDGSVHARVSTSSAAWLARWVLGYGLQAEAVAPQEQRAYMARLCAEAAAAYENHDDDVQSELHGDPCVAKGAEQK